MRAFFIGFYVTLAFGFTASAQSDQIYQITPEHSHLESMTLPQLEKEQVNAELFRDLTKSKTEIEQSTECGFHFGEAQDTLAELKHLNNEYRGRANATYQARAQDLKSRNGKALQTYKLCFADRMQTYDAIFGSSIRTYEQHRSAFKRLEQEPNFAWVTSLDEYIEDLKTLIEHKARGPVVAKVLSNFGEVQISLDGKTGWQVVKKGDALRQGYFIKTNARSRTRVEFDDHEPELGRGPTIVNIAPNSVVKLGSFIHEPNSDTRRGLIDLLRGAVRASVKGWGARSRFSIRTGTSICGIRGTEVGVVYNPDTGIADYHLDHGDAFAETNGRQITLQPKTSIRVQNGQFGAPQPTPTELWDNLVKSTEVRQSEMNESIANISNDTQPTSTGDVSRINRPDDGGGSIPNSKTVEEGFAQLEALRAEVKSRETPGSKIISRTMAVDFSAGRLMEALKNGEGMRALIYMQGELRGIYEKELQNQSLYDLQNKANGRILYFDKRCRVCNQDSTKCGVIMDVSTEKKNNKRPYAVLIELEPNRLDDNMLATTLSEPNQTQLDWYGQQYKGCR